MKRALFGVLALLSIFLALPSIAQADNYYAVDPLGHKSLYDEGGAMPSPEGTHFTFRPYDGDIEAQLQGSGSNNDSGNDEHALFGITPYLFVARATAIGVSIARPDLSNLDWLRIAPTLKHYIAVGPKDSWLKFIKAQLFSYNFATGEDAGFSGGAFSIDPRITAGAEFPLGGNIAFQGEAGLLLTLTSLSQDVTNTADPMLGGTFIYRIRPKPAG